MGKGQIMAKNWNKYTILSKVGIFKVIGEFDSYTEAKEHVLRNLQTARIDSWYIMRGSKEYHI